MKQKFLFTLSTVAMVLVLSACTDNEVQAPVAAATEDECYVIYKKIIKLDHMINALEGTSAKMVAEGTASIPAPEVTQSNNKTTMLRDAKAKKAAAYGQYQSLGCKAPIGL